MNLKPKRNALCHPDKPHIAHNLCKTCYAALPRVKLQRKEYLSRSETIEKVKPRQRIYASQWRIKNREKCRTYSRERLQIIKETNPEKHQLINQKHREYYYKNFEILSLKINLERKSGIQIIKIRLRGILKKTGIKFYKSKENVGLITLIPKLVYYLENELIMSLKKVKPLKPVNSQIYSTVLSHN